MAEESTNKPADKSVSLAESRRAEMNDIKSDLRNQVSVQDVADFQLLSNTPAQLIVAMTNMSLEQLQARAELLGTTLKGNQAGSVVPK